MTSFVAGDSSKPAYYTRTLNPLHLRTTSTAWTAANANVIQAFTNCARTPFLTMFNSLAFDALPIGYTPVVPSDGSTPLYALFRGTIEKSLHDHRDYRSVLSDHQNLAQSFRASMKRGL
jgi:hypothetical protein